MFRRIIVPLDGSQFAEQAMGPALTLAESTGAELLLLRAPIYANVGVHMTHEYDVHWHGERVVPVRDEVKNYLRFMRERKLKPGMEIRVLVEDGDPGAVIVDTAEAEDADLIIMATHGRTGLSRWVFGSVTERVTRHAPCSVLVLHDARPVNQIVITLDGSELAEMALAPGTAVARACGSDVTLLRVQQAHDVDPGSFSELERVEVGMGQQFSESVFHVEEAYLEDLSSRMRGTFGGRVHTAVLEGTPANAIVDYVDRRHVDLVVMTTHGRSGLRRWLYGSVTEKVLHGANCHVLIVRPQERQRRVDGEDGARPGTLAE